MNFYKIYFFIFIIIFSKENKPKTIITEPFLPTNKIDNAVKKYHISKYNLNHPRYHFQDTYNNRKIFKINYSYYPYIKISAHLTYEKNAIKIYASNGMLNLTQFVF